MKICSKCGEKFESGKFCKYCGGALVDEVEQIQKKLCSKCGAVLKENSRFCSCCGSKVSIQENSKMKLPDLDLNQLYKYDSKTLFVTLCKSLIELDVNIILEIDYFLHDKYGFDKPLIDALLKLEEFSNDAVIQYWIGTSYMHDWLGAGYNAVKAFEWYQKSAELGYAEAQYSLYECYLIGRGTKKNFVKAFDWLRKVALQGDAKAQYKLALCYISGCGCDKDNEKAIDWLNKASAQHYQFSIELMKNFPFHNCTRNVS